MGIAFLKILPFLFILQNYDPKQMFASAQGL